MQSPCGTEYMSAKYYEYQLTFFIAISEDTVYLFKSITINTKVVMYFFRIIITLHQAYHYTAYYSDTLQHILV